MQTILDVVTVDGANIIVTTLTSRSVVLSPSTYRETGKCVCRRMVLTSNCEIRPKWDRTSSRLGVVLDEKQIKEKDANGTLTLGVGGIVQASTYYIIEIINLCKSHKRTRE
jgi:hypothetical protein